MLPFLGMAASLIILPILARTAGTDGWVALAIGQSAGGLCALIVSYGWNVAGPARIARLTDCERREAFSRSLLVRGSVFVAVMPVLIAVVTNVSPSETTLLALTMAIAAALGGLSPNWYAIGVGRASYVAMYDLVPRLAATAVAFPIIAFTRNPVWYPALLSLAIALSYILFSLVVVRPTSISGGWRDGLIEGLRDDLMAACTVVTGGAYSTGTLLIVGAAASVKESASATSADRVFRVCLQAVAALSNALVAWVIKVPALRNRRMIISLGLHSLVGVFGLAFLSIAGPAVTTLLFGETLSASRPVTTLYGIAFLAISVNTSLGMHILVPTGHIRVVLGSTLAGAVIGVPLIFWGALSLGAFGAAIGIAFSEVAVTAIQAVAAARAFGRYRIRRGPVRKWVQSGGSSDDGTSSRARVWHREPRRSD